MNIFSGKNRTKHKNKTSHFLALSAKTNIKNTNVVRIEKKREKKIPQKHTSKDTGSKDNEILGINILLS